jgi:hypothetical protein
MADAREREGALHRVGVDRAQPVGTVLGDNREEVAEQRALVLGELRGALGVEDRRIRRDVLGTDAGVALAVGRGLVVLRRAAGGAPSLDLRCSAGLGAGGVPLAVRAVLRRRALGALRLV